MKQILTFLILFFFATNIFATHNRAGEITYRQIAPLTYEVTITTYTKADAPADRCELLIHWGDNTESVLVRLNGPAGANGCQHMGVMVDNNIKKNVYIGTHTYPAASTYTLYMLDPNRNEGVLNINNSVNEPFYIQSIIKIGTGLGYNSSPVLLNPPTDYGCVNTPYIHNVSAYDADGDSLSYKMVNCRGAEGRELTTTYSPEYNLDKVEVDTQGTIHWDTPIFAGIYNVAIEISEHRKDPISGEWKTIGRILRDIQIDVTACTNNPPVIKSEKSFCIVGGDNLNFTVIAEDEDGDKITLVAVGGPLETTPTATFPFVIEQPSPVSSEFNWSTDCSLARRSPYQVTLRANDYPYDQHGNRIPGLSTQTVVDIRVLAPAIENLAVVENPNTANFSLSWDNNNCSSAIGYKVFRKEHSGDYNTSYCQSGVPENSGYELITRINDVNQTSYTDTNNNKPLKIGVRYCYIVTTILFDESESIPSDYSCATLKKRLPVLTNVDIETTAHSEITQGEINIIWSKPTEIDVVEYPGPYAYKLLRAEGINSNNFTEIHQYNTINDTIYFDSGMDTYSNGYNYRVDFYNNTGGIMSKIGESYPASSPYLKIKSGDTKLQLKIDQEVAWRVDSIIYYQEIDQTNVYERIAKTSGAPLTVENLTNGTEYCFKADIYGSYSADGYVKPLLNRSQIGCGTPNVNTLQCPPILSFDKNCSNNSFLLYWTNPNLTCDEEIIGYKLYYSDFEQNNFEFLAAIDGEDNTEYDVIANNIGIGCFYVTGVDILGNETIPSNIKCYIPCLAFALPNVFTPNDDGNNDTYHPKWEKGGLPEFDFDLIAFDIEIFNRWGNLMYKTDIIQINWDGTNQMTGEACAPGVYYYVCTIVKKEGDEKENTITLTGYIHLFK